MTPRATAVPASTARGPLALAASPGMWLYMASAQRDKAFEVFIKRAVAGIQKESWGRTREAKDIRDACQHLLNLLDQHEAGSISVDGSLALAVLQPLQLACGSSNVKIVELALGALHKLVAHAWLQGESSASEDLIADETDTVTRVIKLVIKCGEISNVSLQLSVIRALLTFTTAEHFVAHGDSLMSAVRTVFNLALGSEDDNIRRTACNALLQMLNTVAKRVTAYQVHSVSTTPSRRESGHDNTLITDGSFSQLSLRTRSHTFEAGHHTHPSSLDHPEAEHGSEAAEHLGRTASMAGSATQHHDTGEEDLPSDARVAQYASLADQHDLSGLEAVIGGTCLPIPDPAVPRKSSSGAAQPTADASRPGSQTPPPPSTAGGPLPSPAGLGAASGALTPSGSAVAASSVSPALSSAGAGPTPPQLQLVPLSQLNVTERDVLLVLTAFCKLASREAGLTEVESYLHQGKLLALELLVKVFQNPQHRWENVRDALTHHLRHPLCITLLRNCASTDTAAFQLAIKLLLAVMLQPKLRRGLKPELGAFYPLFVLRPLEQGCQAGVGPDAGPGGLGAGAGVGAMAAYGQEGGRRDTTDLHTLFIVLSSLKQLCSEPQLVVDLFVNYDCDLAAPALFERTMHALGWLAQKQDVSDLSDPLSTSRGGGQMSVKQQQEALARLAAVREAAQRCIMAVVVALESWTQALREGQGAKGAVPPSTAQDSPKQSEAPEHGSQGSTDSQPAAEPASEAERLEAVWALKTHLSRAISLFNSSPVKGVRYLVKQGMVDNQPQAVAQWLRTHAGQLDKSALGEYFGHHDEFEVAVMHAWVDMEQYAGAALDQALRSLLGQFRLPGEAQKIDRIMEKFAERYVIDNSGQFRNADGAYLLSFAIIMLNTDAHNPLAERRLGQADFVAMCHQPLSEEEGGGSEPVLPPLELEAIYQRIVSQELQLHDADMVAQRAQAAAARQQQLTRFSSRTRLAAALGLQGLVTPWKPLAKNWGKGLAQPGVTDKDRKRALAQLAERAISQSPGGTWTTAQHAELARPMLTVAAQAIVDALAAGLATAGSVAAAEPLLRCLVSVVQLAGALRLEEVGDKAVGVLAAAAGVAQPAAYASPQEQKQLAALKALLALGVSEAGHLGSGWTLVLRTLSALDILTAQLTAPAVVGPSGRGIILAGTAAPGPSSADSSLVANNPFNKMFQALGINLGIGNGSPMGPAAGAGSAQGQAADAGAGNGERGPAGVPAVRLGPGASLVLWAEAEGKPLLQQLSSLSSLLDGDTVVVYVRAMCAVSREELDRTQPRAFFLQRVVEAAHANLGRIRLVWGRLWSVISAHLVAAACHPSQGVALFAVDALRGVAARLLARTELVHFRAQQEALRPFVSVLRQSDDPAVRRAVVTTVGQLLSLHARRGLGSGWRTLMELLIRAVGDPVPGIAALGLEVLQQVVDALYRPAPAGHACLPECLLCVATAARNSSCPEALGLTAVQLLVGCAARLADAGQARAAGSEGGAQAVESLGSSRGGGAGRADEANGAMANGAAAPSLLSQHSSGVLPGNAGGGPRGLQSSSSVDLRHGKEAGGSSSDGWSMLLCSMADMAQHDPRPRVANAAMQAIFDVLQHHSSHFSCEAWQVLLGQVLAALFKQLSPALQPAARASVSGNASQGDDSQGRASTQPSAEAGQQAPSADFIARMTHFFPLMCAQLSRVPEAYHAQLLAQLGEISVAWMLQANEALALLGLSALEQLLNSVAEAGQLSSWQHLMQLLTSILHSELQVVMSDTQVLQARQQRKLKQTGDSRSSRRSSSSSSGGNSLALVDQHALASRLRTRSHLLLLAHRLLGRLYQQHMQRLAFAQLEQLLQPLLSTAHSCCDFNQQLETAMVQAMVQTPGIMHIKSLQPSMPSAAALFMQPKQHQASPPQQQVAQGTGGLASAAPLTVASQPATQAANPNPEGYASGGLAAAPAGSQPTPAAQALPPLPRTTDEDMADTILEMQDCNTPLSSSGPSPAADQAGKLDCSAQETHDSAASHTAERHEGAAVGGLQQGARSTGQAHGPELAGLAGPAGAGGQEGVQLFSPHSHTLVHLGLARLELEAASIALDCLWLGAGQQPSQPELAQPPDAQCAAGDMQLAQASQQLLAHFCRKLLVQCASGQASRAQQQQQQQQQGGALHTQPPPPQEPFGLWMEGVRAPLLARALYAYLQLPGCQAAQDVLMLFPDMLTLMCSAQPAVREAVAAYFRQVVQPIVNQAASAGKAGTIVIALSPALQAKEA
ncbi:hypothetical protein QJQ45_025726 [Haematococcus lacustris]|nr:hypothetical protein QJQ45_025726 [Haematococcus lacustris]